MRELEFGGKSAIWGGATLGLIIGFVIGLFTGNIGSSMKNGIIVGLVLGIVAEILGVISNYISRRNNAVDQTFLDKGFAEDKYLQKYAKLLGSAEYNALYNERTLGKPMFERIDQKLSKKDKNDMYQKIDTADFLSPRERFETIVALFGLFGGLIPKSKKVLIRPLVY